MSLDELCCFDSFAIIRNHKNRVHEKVVQNDSLRNSAGKLFSVIFLIVKLFNLIYL